MAYTTFSEVQSYLDITTTGDAPLINELVARAQSAIDIYTGRKFEHSTVAATRYFSVGVDTDGPTLHLDEDLCKISTIKSNCDGTTVSISTTEYVTEPRNIKPYHKITLLSSTTSSWDYTDDPENGVQIAGCWSYSTVAPDDIKHACIRLAAYYYRQRDSQVFDVTAIPDAGVITMPKGIPADVKQILDPYRKVVF